MASSSDNISMAVFCDFENVALGVRDANYEKFDIKPVLERLLLKGSIVVKKAYCDWDRYKGFKSTMHEANFELIEIPHVRQSGKNSADIRLVVDALDLCYTKSHVDTFVIISGDSDFSPLVSKLRENAKHVIGVGVKQSTSDLLVANCDEFIFYDDLVREVKRAAAKRDEKRAQPAPRRSPDEKSARKEEVEARKTQALELVVEMFDALVSERGDSGKIWASLLKDTLKRRRPDFNEAYYGFRTFGNLLEEAQSRGLLEFGRDEKSGAYVYRSNGAQASLPAMEQDGIGQVDENSELAPADEAPAERAPKESRRRGRGGRKPRDEQVTEALDADPVDDEEVAAEPLQAIEPESEPVDEVPGVATPAERAPKEARRRGRGGRKPREEAVSEPVEAAPEQEQEQVQEPEQEQEQAVEAVAAAVEAPPEKRRTPRAPRKAAARKTAPVVSEEPLEDAIEQAIAEEPAAPPEADVAAGQLDAEAGEEDAAAPKRRSPRGRRPVKPRVPKTPA